MDDWRNALCTLWRRPWLHFVMLGGLVFLLRAGFGPELPAQPPPTDEDLLFRKGLELGLDQELPVRRRLIQNMRFLAVDPEASDDELIQQARDLGFHQTDPVVRRYLVEKMRLLARAGGGPEVFAEAELEAYRQAHPEQFSLPAYVRLSQVFFSGDLRGPAGAADAERVLAQLRSNQVKPEAAASLGDPFPVGNHTPMVAATDLERIYGSRFAAAVMRLPVGEWSGPIESAQGQHLVWISEARQPELAPLAEVRSRVVLAMVTERGEARLAAYLQKLRERSGDAEVLR